MCLSNCGGFKGSITHCHDPRLGVQTLPLVFECQNYSWGPLSPLRLRPPGVWEEALYEMM